MNALAGHASTVIFAKLKIKVHLEDNDETGSTSKHLSHEDLAHYYFRVFGLIRQSSLCLSNLKSRKHEKLFKQKR